MSALTRRIGIAPLTHLELSPVEMVAIAHETGYDFVGLRVVAATTTEPQYDFRPGSPLVQDVRLRLDGTGIAVGDIEIFRLKPDTRVSDYEPYLQLGAEFGAKHALIAMQDPDVFRLADNFARFAELASHYALTADVEPTPWYEVSSLSLTSDIIARSGARNAGVVIDPIHFDRTGEDVATLRSIPAGNFHYAQICDAPAARPETLDGLLHQARAERLIPGDGGLPLHAIVAALPPDLPLSVEVPMQKLSQTMNARDRARLLLERTRQFLRDHATTTHTQPVAFS